MNPAPQQPVGDALPASIEKRLSNEAEKPAVPPPEPPNKEYEGSLKSLSGKHGYGFIVCEEVYKVYGRDVYLPRELVPEDVKVLDRLLFTVVLSKEGHLQAKTVNKEVKV